MKIGRPAVQRMIPGVVHDQQRRLRSVVGMGGQAVDNKPTIDAAVYDAVMALPPHKRRDRAKVNEAVAEAERAKAESSDDAVYDDRHYVQCRWCGKWINGSDPARLAEHRGPLPHPIMPGTEWVDDDD